MSRSDNHDNPQSLFASVPFFGNIAVRHLREIKALILAGGFTIVTIMARTESDPGDSFPPQKGGVYEKGNNNHCPHGECTHKKAQSPCSHFTAGNRRGYFPMLSGRGGSCPHPYKRQ